MKKSILAKIILLIITFILVVCIFTNVFAADDVPSLMGNTVVEDEKVPDLSFPQPETENKEEPETPTTPEEPGTPTEPEKNTISNSSEYEESDIPYAGPETSILIVASFVVCAIIGIYTFMKLSDYSNI